MKAKHLTFPIFLTLSAVFLALLLLFFKDFIFDPSNLMLNSDQLNSIGTRYIRHGLVLTQWNPYFLGGMPTLDATFGDAYHPLVFLHSIMDPARAVGFKFIATVFIAFLSSLVLFSYLTKNWMSGAVLSLLVALNPQFFSLIYGGHDGKMMCFSVAPLAIYGLLKILREGKLLGALLLCLSLVYMLLSSHLQITYFFLWGIFFYSWFITLVDERKKTPLKTRLFRQGILGVAVAAALLMGSIQILPPYEYTSHYSVRGSDENTNIGHAASWSMHQEELAGLILPDFSGIDVQERQYWGHNSFKLNFETPGLTLLLLGFIALCGLRKRKEHVFWLIGMTVVICYSLGGHTPFFKLFYEIAPGVNKFRAPAMTTFWLPLALGIMASSLFLPKQKEEKEPGVKQPVLAFGALVLFLTLARFAWDSIKLNPMVGTLCMLGIGLIVNGLLWYQYHGGKLEVKSCLSGITSGMKGVPKIYLISFNLPIVLLIFIAFSADSIVQTFPFSTYFKPLNIALMQATQNSIFHSTVVALVVAAAIWMIFTKIRKGSFDPAHRQKAFIFGVASLLAYLFLQWIGSEGKLEFITLLIAGGLAFWYYSNEKENNVEMGLIILALIGLSETMIFNSPFIQNVPKEKYLPQNQPHITYIQNQMAQDSLNDFRVMTLSNVITPNNVSAYKLRNALGFHDNELNSYREFRGGRNSTNLLYKLQQNQISSNPFMNLLNIKYLLYDAPTGLSLIRNDSAFNRTTVYHHYQVIPEKDILSALKNETFDYRKVMALSSDSVLNGKYTPYKKESLPSLPDSLPEDSTLEQTKETLATVEPSASSRIIESQSPDHLTIETLSSENGLLLISENYHPYWKAKVNGQEKKVFKAFGNLQAVEIPAGKATVEMLYQSDAVEFSKKLVEAGAGICGILFILSLCEMARRKPKVPQKETDVKP